MTVAWARYFRRSAAKPSRMDKYLFSYATASDPPIKRGLIRLVEKATGQPKLKRMYVQNQRFPRSGESFWQAAVRSLELDVRYDADALAPIPRTGPVVFVANHPYGVLDGIVMAWLVEQGPKRFRRAHPRRARRARRRRRGSSCRWISAGTEEARAEQSRLARRRARALEQGGAVVVFPAGGDFDRAGWARPASPRSTRAGSRSRRNSSSARKAPSCRSGSAARTAASSRSRATEPDAPALADLPRSASAHRRRACPSWSARRSPSRAIAADERPPGARRRICAPASTRSRGLPRRSTSGAGSASWGRSAPSENEPRGVAAGSRSARLAEAPTDTQLAAGLNKRAHASRPR